jgi:protease IV
MRSDNDINPKVGYIEPINSLTDTFKMVLILAFIIGALFFWGEFAYTNFYKPDVNIIVELKDEQTNAGIMINADSVISPLKEAVKKNPKLIIIKANSGGGRIVQGERIYNYIKSIDIPIHTVIGDRCVSSCYYAISSSDKIYSSKSSEVGGIGVLHYTAPKNQLDNMPIIFAYSGTFKNPTPEKEYIHKHMKTSARIIHESMIKDIKIGRGKALKGSQEELFEGLAWEGIRAKKLGLIDNFGSIDSLLEE